LEDHVFSSKQQLDEALTSAVSKCLRQALEQNNKAVLLVSGGTTPVKFFQNLSMEDLDWAKVTVLLADERWVAQTSDRSNERLVRDNLLKNKAEMANFISYFDQTMSPNEKAEIFNQDPCFLSDPADVLLLGMGADGHTASLFPDAENIKSLMDEESNKRILPVSASSVPEQRITLTFPILTNAKNLFLHFTGDLKREVLQKALSGQAELPVGQVLKRAAGEVSVYWAA